MVKVFNHFRSFVLCTCAVITIFYWTLFSHNSATLSHPFTTNPTLKNEATDSPAIMDQQGLLSIEYCLSGLGNHMFQFASLIGIANKTGRIPVTFETKEPWIIRRVFKISLNEIHHNVSWNVIKERCIGCYDPQKYTSLNSSLAWQLQGALQSYKYFHFMREEVRKQLQFKEQTIKASLVKKSTIVQRHCNNTSCLLIGVHVRRGDFLLYEGIGFKVANESYISAAVQFYQKEFPETHLVFVVLGNDYEWSFETFSKLNGTAVVLQTQTVDGDLCLLSLCDHMIMTVGTYGWWAGFLGRGKVVYLQDQYRIGSELEKSYEGGVNMFPNNWIPL